MIYELTREAVSWSITCYTCWRRDTTRMSLFRILLVTIQNGALCTMSVHKLQKGVTLAGRGGGEVGRRISRLGIMLELIICFYNNNNNNNNNNTVILLTKLVNHFEVEVLAEIIQLTDISSKVLGYCLLTMDMPQSIYPPHTSVHSIDTPQFIQPPHTSVHSASAYLSPLNHFMLGRVIA